MANVCLILEGTYPYVTGGVSAWVQTLLTGLPDLTFAVVHLRAGDDETSQPQYSPPPNLVEFVEWPLDLGEARVWRREIRNSQPFGYAQDRFEIRNSTAPLPQARVYHALSTGFAGLLGCQVKTALGRPLLLTEHGIYWREAQAGADELECGFRVVPAGQTGIDLRPLRDHWTMALQDLAREAYYRADAITTVCQANARLQAALGAPSSRCHVIHNGVDWRALAPGEIRSPATDGVQRIGFVGRVVTIKDVTTFLAACRLVAGELPGVEFYVIGPTDHDPAYAAHCQALVAELGLEEHVTFTGETDPLSWYRRLDVVVLTSLSEGQPLVLLEAMAAGVPVVATVVGGCPELVQGTTAPDRALGTAGLLTPVGDPRATARAVLALCQDVDRWHQASRAGQERVRRFYSTDQLCEAYRALYERWL
ncbi:MAG: GT4 family glycosyltransferase PelF [Anaerolineae bacterium]